MSGDPSDQVRSTALEQLKALGLSIDAARTFVHSFTPAKDLFEA